MKYDGRRAREFLRDGCRDPDAEFRDGQEEAIRSLLEDGARLLLVQKTGWGKSFVYFIATRLLREAGQGPALLISPLLALMHNQIAAAKRMGVRRRDHPLRQPERVRRGRTGRPAGRGRHPAHLARTPSQRTLPFGGAVADRGPGVAAGRRRGALHLRLGARFSPALPAP